MGHLLVCPKPNKENLPKRSLCTCQQANRKRTTNNAESKKYQSNIKI